MAAQEAYLARPGYGLGRGCDCLVGVAEPERAVGPRREQTLKLRGAEAGQGGIDRHAHQGGQFALQQRAVPACGLVAFVVHETVGAGLGRAQPGDRDDRHLGEAELQARPGGGCDRSG